MFGREVVKENGEEDEDGVERKWEKREKSENGKMSQMKLVVRFMHELD